MLFLFTDADAGTPVAPQYTPHASSVAPEFGRAFAEACLRDTPQSTSDLRCATVALVERLKADALPPERVIVAIKAALMRYGGCRLPPSFAADDGSAAGERQATTYRRVFGWCLDAYYGTE